MAALIEGMAGVKDAPLSQAFSHPVVAPRWDLGEARTIRATVRYAASSPAALDYLALAREEPERVKVIDATAPIDTVAEAVWASVEPRVRAR